MTDTPISPLRRRMIEDMTVRKFAARTQDGYIRAVKGFSTFLGTSPATASAEDLRRYRLHLVESGVGAPTINHSLTALRFLFLVTLRNPAIVLDMPFVREPRRLPVVLSPQEVARLLDAAPGVARQSGWEDVLPHRRMFPNDRLVASPPLLPLPQRSSARDTSLSFITCLFAVAGPVELWATRQRRPSGAANPQGVARQMRHRLSTLRRCPQGQDRSVWSRIPFGVRLHVATPLYDAGVFSTVRPGRRRDTLPAAARTIRAMCARALPRTTPAARS